MIDKKLVLFNLFILQWPLYKSEETNFKDVTLQLCSRLTHLADKLTPSECELLHDKLTVYEALTELNQKSLNFLKEKSQKNGDAIFIEEDKIKEIKDKVIRLFYSYFEPNINLEDKKIYTVNYIRSKDYIMTFINNGGWDMIENLRKGTIIERHQKLVSLYNSARLLAECLLSLSRDSNSVYRGIKGNIHFDKKLSQQMRNILRVYLREEILSMENLQNMLIQNSEFINLTRYAGICHDILTLDITRKETNSMSKEELLETIHSYEDYYNGSLRSDILSGNNKHLLKQINILENTLKQCIEENLKRTFNKKKHRDNIIQILNLTTKEEETMCYHYYYPLWFQMIDWKTNYTDTDICSFLYDLGIIFGFNTKENLKKNEKLKQVHPYIKSFLQKRKELVAIS